MDDPSTLFSFSPFLLPILLLFSAFFSSAETAVFSLSAWEVHRLRERPVGINRMLLGLVDNPRRLLITSLIGNTFVNIGFATLFTSLSLRIVHDRMGAATSTALTVATVGSTALLLLFGEIAPKTYAIRYAYRMARLVAPVLWLFSWLLTPLRWLVRLAVDLTLRVVGAQGMEVSGTVTQEEIREIVRSGEEMGALAETEGRVIERILELREMTAKDIMVPRTDMVAVPITTSVEEALQVAKVAGHSRLPVYQQTLDQVVAIFVVKALPRVRHLPGLMEKSLGTLLEELSRSPRTRETLLHSPLIVPESRRLDALLRDFSQAGIQMAIVVDEYGGTAGLVTLEDVIEVIVGQIVDEYDELIEQDLGEELTGEALERGIQLPARMSLRLARRLLRAPLHSQEADTLGGYVYHLLGRVPVPGETVQDEQGFEFAVIAMSGARIQRVLVRRLRPPEEEEE
ncbi:MAG: hemolysin [Candidatus Poribacteria bacterium]|nr:MAG: hemolysin [Candidatus Poribacteria bacterium]